MAGMLNRRRDREAAEERDRKLVAAIEPPQFTVGDRVVSTVKGLGLVSRRHPGTRFVDTVEVGTPGTIVEDAEFAKIGWMAVVFDGHEKDEDGEDLICPVGPTHVSAAVR